MCQRPKEADFEDYKKQDCHHPENRSRNQIFPHDYIEHAAFVSPSYMTKFLSPCQLDDEEQAPYCMFQTLKYNQLFYVWVKTQVSISLYDALFKKMGS